MKRLKRFLSIAALGLLALPALSAARLVEKEDLQCGSEATYLAIAEAKHRLFERRRGRREMQEMRAVSETSSSRVTAPAVDVVGNVAVINDDGTLVAEANPFDLSQRGLQFRRKKKGVKAGGFGGDLDLSFGEKITIGDDASAEIDLAFGFRFFGKRYRKVFLNSDGNLTFGSAESASSERSLSRFLNGPPRIAPFFDDLDPTATSGEGGVYIDNRDDLLRVTWFEVPEWDRSNRNTFQVTLFRNGRITFVYGNLDAAEAVVGLAPGGSDVFDLLDLSFDLPFGKTNEALAERFGLSDQIDDFGVVKTFLEHFRDDYDVLLVWADFPADLGDAFAYSITLKNQVRGIGRRIGDATAAVGGAKRFQTVVQMGDQSRYPDDPDLQFFRAADSTLTVMAHEVGHRFLAFVRFRDASGQASDDLLGRQSAHWSYFFDTDASVLEGNDIRDNGDGTFSTVAATEKYSKLDQYLMGLVAPEEVPDLFYVTDETSNADPDSNPRLQDNFFGTRVDLTLDDIIAVEGPRDPSWSDARNTFKTAFLVIGKDGQPVSEGAKARIKRFRKRWQAAFSDLTDGNGKVKTKLKRRKSS